MPKEIIEFFKQKNNYFIKRLGIAKEETMSCLWRVTLDKNRPTK